MTEFEKWFNSPEGYGLKSERFYESLDAFAPGHALKRNMVLWLEAAFAAGRESRKCPSCGAKNAECAECAECADQLGE
jgi:hypothetical protein